MISSKLISTQADNKTNQIVAMPEYIYSKKVIEPSFGHCCLVIRADQQHSGVEIFLLIAMPELVECKKCGKQVITSRYSWSDQEVICQVCAEEKINVELQETNGLNEKDVELLNTNYSEVLTSNDQVEDNADSECMEIVITWPLIIRIAASVVFSLGLLGSIFVISANLNRDFQVTPTQSSNTNTFK